MPTIELETKIEAPIEICFDLCRSIDLHQVSTEGTNEKAIGGVTSGLISLGETVTWRAKHFGVYQKLTSIITAYEYPTLFRDEMVSGAFDYFVHTHRLHYSGTVTTMEDTFEYRSPLGVLGQIVDFLILERYMKRFLEKRNVTIKEYAEGDGWKTILQ